MDSYSLSRQWFDWCFENPEKINPSHGALYFYIIEHCNRMGWKEKFGLPTTVAKDAIGIKSYNTFINTLRDLEEWGFIKMIQKSRNQYTANIIALSKIDKALDKALDKAMLKHLTKQGESTSESICSIIKPITNKLLTLTPKNYKTNIEFDVFWNLYNKKVGDRAKLEKKWTALKDEDRENIINYLPGYIKSTPDKKFRKNPETFFNNRSWNDEVLDKGEDQQLLKEIELMKSIGL